MRCFLLILLLLAAAFCQGQNPLSFSRQSGVHTYVYKINEKETEALAVSEMYKVSEKYLHTLVDSFSLDLPRLAAGNYLLVQAIEGELNFTLHTEGDIQVKLVNNNRDLVVAVHDRQGRLIENARVFKKNKKLHYDPATKTYRLQKHRRAGILKVYHNNALHVFPVQKYKRRESLLRTIVFGFPLKYVSAPVDRLLKGYGPRRGNFYGWTKHEQKFRGFMVFSKPRYKPGDTVKFKAFITTKKGRPVNEKLLVRISQRNSDLDTIVAQIQPYRNGGYEFSFVLNESFDMELDREYLVTLEELKSRKYVLDDYYGNLSDDEHLGKRKVLIRNEFKFEEYELDAVTFFARLDHEKHNRGSEASVFVRAMDENEMAVLDGRVRLIVRPENFNHQKKFNDNRVFLADTLWDHEQAIENLGETRIIIPDSIFPAASFGYQVDCIFLNTNNERQNKTVHGFFSDNINHIVFDLINDSLAIHYRQKSAEGRSGASLIGLSGEGDTIEQKIIDLPYVLKVNPFIKTYKVITGNTHETFSFSSKDGGVVLNATRSKDSIKIYLANPNKLQVWYTVFAGNKVIHRGRAEELWLEEKTRTRKNYFVSLQYVYGGQVKKQDYSIPYLDKELSVKIEQPEFVYPGQTATVHIDVKDGSGEAVGNADVTAYSITKKFRDAEAPRVPYLGKTYRYRKYSTDFTHGEDLETERSIMLNWERWSREMNLDSIEYYKFLFPALIYSNTEATPDSTTQIAPFVVIKGQLQPIHQLYIDEVPVFFSQADQLRRYSFRISPGKHSLRMRTSNAMVTLNDVWMKPGVKTFISANGQTNTREVKVQKMPPALTEDEVKLWRRYMIIVENNFGENYSYIEQGRNVFLLNRYYNYGRPVLAGPFPYQHASLVVKNKYDLNFDTEGGYSYFFNKQLIRQKELRPGYGFNRWLSPAKHYYNFHDLVLTKNQVDSLWNEYLDHRSADEDLFTNLSLSQTGNGKLEIEVDTAMINRFIRNILVFKNDDPDFLQVYKGTSRDLGYLRPGSYRLFFLLKGDQYVLRDSILIRKNGVNFYRIPVMEIKAKDSVSQKIWEVISNREKGRQGPAAYELDDIKRSFNSQYLSQSGFTETISGTISDEEGNPIPNASVVIKGTNIGVVTDIRGNFILNAPAEAVIVVSAVGFSGRELRTSGFVAQLVTLPFAKLSLEEVVVVGYGTSRKTSFSAVTSTVLSGRVPGVMIRGVASINSQPAMIVVDGIPVTAADFEKIPPSEIDSVTTLSPDVATSLYGSRAANGVILVTTKNKKKVNASAEEMPFEGNSLRRNFRDDAFWQPRLRTDANGRASFKVTYPDDITNWRTFVLVMGNKKRSGQAESETRSFKSLSANLALPTFAVTGDAINFIGKTLNYSTDSVSVKRSFFINDVVAKQGMIGLRNSWIDSFSVVVLSQDSLQLKYFVEKQDGYFDGEERSLPVFPQGVKETTGFFAALNGDTTFDMKFPADTGMIRLYAEASLFPVWEEEIERVRNYEYDCNEQLASKLKALLVQKKIDQYLKRTFKGEQNVRQLISRLKKNRAESGLWGWWNNSYPSTWISLHVMEALVQAMNMGYQTDINTTLLKNYLLYNLESFSGTEKLSGLHLLYLLDTKADLKKYADSIDKEPGKKNMYEQLRLIELRQKAGLPFLTDSMIKRQSRTMMGNVYWGEDSHRFFDNSIQNTLIMYRILKSRGGQEELLTKIRNYFLEQRKSGQWRNTYESSLILETILPDLLVNDSVPKPSTLVLSGARSQVVEKFPFSTTINAGSEVSVKKTGSLPIYFTAYEQHWNAQPAKHAGDFEVSTWFQKGVDVIDMLKAGEPVLLKIKVVVKADADYVMLDVPIPAGCSYSNKAGSFLNNEVHREHFKHKVSIFSSGLKKGEYEFSVSLLPRYNGTYHLNPARAELMYFPVFYGREGMKKISIN